jgi:hypothetical protein
MKSFGQESVLIFHQKWKGGFLSLFFIFVLQVNPSGHFSSTKNPKFQFQKKKKSVSFVQRLKVHVQQYRPSPDEEDRSSCNLLLYIGLAMASIGLVISFVGLGKNGFKSIELKLIGPSMVGCGLLLALIRILYSFAPFWEKEDDSEKLILKKEDLNIFDEPDVERFHDIAPRPRHTEPCQISFRPAVQPAWNTDATNTLVTGNSWLQEL